MMWRAHSGAAIVLWLLVLWLPACASYPPALPTAHLIPGGLARLEIPPHQTKASWQFKNRPVWVLPEPQKSRAHSGKAFAIVGIPLNTEPGTLAVHSDTGAGLHFQVQPHAYEESRLVIKNQAHVTPPTKDLDRIRKEAAEIRAQFRVFSKRQPSLPFILPTSGIQSSAFGLRRYLNDQPRRPHSGLDIGAPTGTPVRAAADGTVLKTNHYYFNGKTIFIDHGQGLVTLYCHLDSVQVTSGQQVTQGTVIGTVGSTGRSTGAHLHWAANLGGTMVNPLLFIGDRRY